MASAPSSKPPLGDRLTARDVAAVPTEITGTPSKLQWAGTAGSLSVMSKAMGCFSRDGTEPFPAWRGMQYLVSMFSGQAQLHHVDNLRYCQREWTTVRDLLGAHLGATELAVTA